MDKESSSSEGAMTNYQNNGNLQIISKRSYQNREK